VTSPPPCRDPAEGQIGRDHGPVPLLGGAGQGVCRFQAAPQSIETVDPEGDDEFVLVPEPAIQRHRAVADLGREPPHGETVTPVPNEKPGGDIEESASDGFALSVCKARRHRKSTSRRNIVPKLPSWRACRPGPGSSFESSIAALIMPASPLGVSSSVTLRRLIIPSMRKPTATVIATYGMPGEIGAASWPPGDPAQARESTSNLQEGEA
jgi:hypothetical protein